MVRQPPFEPFEPFAVTFVRANSLPLSLHSVTDFGAVWPGTA